MKMFVLKLNTQKQNNKSLKITTIKYIKLEAGTLTITHRRISTFLSPHGVRLAPIDFERRPAHLR